MDRLNTAKTKVDQSWNDFNPLSFIADHLNSSLWTHSAVKLVFFAVFCIIVHTENKINKSYFWSCPVLMKSTSRDFRDHILSKQPCNKKVCMTPWNVVSVASQMFTSIHVMTLNPLLSLLRYTVVSAKTFFLIPAAVTKCLHKNNSIIVKLLLF